MSRAFNAGIEICSDCGPEHGRPVLDLTQGDCICARCGLVLCQKLIDESSETRNFADDLGQRKNERFSHAGHALGIVRAGGLATTVLSDGMPDAGGAPGRTKLSSTSRLHNKVVGGRDEAFLVGVIEQLSSLCTRLDLPESVSLRCQALFGSCRRGCRARAGSAQDAAMVPALVYIACREGGISRTLREIATAAQSIGMQHGADKKRIGRSVLAITRKLQLQLGTTSPAEFIPRFVSSLETRFVGGCKRKARDSSESAGGDGESGVLAPWDERSPRLRPAHTQAALHAAQAVERLGVGAGRRPDAIAAACLYLVCAGDARLGWSPERARAQVSRATLVSEAVIRTIYRNQLHPVRSELLPRSFADTLQLDVSAQA